MEVEFGVGICARKEVPVVKAAAAVVYAEWVMDWDVAAGGSAWLRRRFDITQD